MTNQGHGGSDVLSVRTAVWVGPGGPGSGCVRKGISAQVILYIWVQPNGVQVDPHLGFLVAPEGKVFLLECKKSAVL